MALLDELLHSMPVYTDRIGKQWWENFDGNLEPQMKSRGREGEYLGRLKDLIQRPSSVRAPRTTTTAAARERPNRPNRSSNTGTTTPSTTTPATPALPTTREGWLQAVSNQFMPGSEIAAVPSSLLDDAIASILSEQQNAAQQYLDRGKARGIYNDVGYNAGLAALGNSTTMGRSDLSSLGASVIDKYRGDLDKVGDAAYTAASGFQPGLKFSLDPYVTQYNDILGRARNNAAGDLRNLMGGRNYFDFANLTNRAGLAQGATNLRDTDVATALAERKRQNLQSRGLGSQGAF